MHTCTVLGVAPEGVLGLHLQPQSFFYFNTPVLAERGFTIAHVYGAKLKIPAFI